MSKQIKIGDITIGGGNIPAIQSMTNADPHDEKAIIRQIDALNDAGCQIVRLAVPDADAAEIFKRIKSRFDHIPLVADIHFDYRLALAAISSGADKIRINPGNIGGKENIKAVVDAAKAAHIPIRVGVNSGSLEKRILEKYREINHEALCESAIDSIKLLEGFDFDDIVVSIKSSNVPMNTEAYRLLASKVEYPLHIGVTEAGTKTDGIIKSAVGIGALLLDDIGDTIRVSLTGDPVREVWCARKILAAVGKRTEPIELISCPTCGRTKVDLDAITSQIEPKLANIGLKRRREGKDDIKVAIMGCEINGPGEAKDADIGIACGNGRGLIFMKGKPLQTIEESDIINTLCEMIYEI